MYQSLINPKMCDPYRTAIPFLGGYLKIIRQVHNGYLQRSSMQNCSQWKQLEIICTFYHIRIRYVNNYALVMEYCITIKKWYCKSLKLYLLVWKDIKYFIK
jgi:hypothetical protein